MNAWTLHLRAARRTVPHVVIAIALCFGAWMVLVQPKLEALAEVNEARTAESMRLSPDQQWRLMQRVEQIRTWVDEVKSLNELSRDSNQLFTTIMELAESHDVQVVSMQPGPPPRQRSGSRSGSVQSTDAASVTYLEIIARGRFEDVGRFIDAVTGTSPFIRPQSLQLSPHTDEPIQTVNARLVCEVMSFTPPPALVKLEGGENAR